MRFKRSHRLPFYIIFGPLIGYLASLVALTALLAIAGAGGAVASAWATGLPLTPIAWMIGLVPFAIATLAAGLGGRVSVWGAYVAAAVTAALLYWVPAVIFFNPPRSLGDIEVTFVLLLAAPIGGAVGAVVCEGLAGRFGRRSTVEGA